jgi:hypothetical protein
MNYTNERIDDTIDQLTAMGEYPPNAMPIVLAMLKQLRTRASELEVECTKQKAEAAFWFKQLKKADSENPFVKLCNMRTLKQGWDGEKQAPPPSEVAINAVWDYLASGGARYALHVDPDVRGGIALQLDSPHGNFGEVHVQVGQDGGLLALLDEKSIGGEIKSIKKPTWESIHLAVLGDLYDKEDDE